MSVGGLAGALLWFGMSTAGAIGAVASAEQLRKRLHAAATLFQAMRPSLDLGRALLRGRYLIAAAAIEATGVPVDLGLVRQLRMNWPAIRDHVIIIIDQDFGFYSGRSFDLQVFTRWVAKRAIPWPRLASGQLDLGIDAFKEMARIEPDLVPIKELRATLSGFDPAMFAIGSDGRNRAPLRPFASSTGRNQPSAKASILGSAKWVRHLIKPQAGMALAHIDWQHAEFGIAAALSDDAAMQAAYHSGDPYVAMAIAAGAIPPSATATSHPEQRAQFKAIVSRDVV
jgi:DNA polymerase I